MNNEILPIKKSDIPDLLLDVVESFSAEAQQAALRKAKEMGFDLNKGNIPFDETLINLSQNRDVLREAVKMGKIPQVPLKIQNSLLSEAKKTSLHLTALANGTDTVLQLENAVEDLTTTVWESNLQLLSGEILGLQTKQNQLKALESSLRNLSRKAEEFGSLERRAEQSTGKIEALAESSENTNKRLLEIATASELLATSAKEIEQRATSSWTSIQQHEKAITDSAASTKLIAADVEAASNRSKQVLADIEALKVEYCPGSNNCF
jgi:methyl-accepting chemotaxis protein